MDLDGITFEPPVGFAIEEHVVALCNIEETAVIRPNLLIHAKRPPPSATLEDLAGEMLAELSREAAGLEQLETGAFEFRDGVLGFLTSFCFSASPGVTLRQFHVLRLDPARVTVATLTLGADVTEALQDEYLRAIASIAVRPD